MIPDGAESFILLELLSPWVPRVPATPPQTYSPSNLNSLPSSTSSTYSKIQATLPHPPGKAQAQLWEETFFVFLCNKIECVRVGVLCFYKLPSLVVIRLKQFSPSVNASLQNHWKHTIHLPIFDSYLLVDRRKRQLRDLFPPKEAGMEQLSGNRT